MGLIMDSDDDAILHAESRRESFVIYTDFGEQRVEVEWKTLPELEHIIGWLKAKQPGKPASEQSTCCCHAPWTSDDKPIPEDREIEAAHPMETGRHDLYEEAMRLVGAKRSKGALVDLVNWLLGKIEKH